MDKQGSGVGRDEGAHDHRSQHAPTTQRKVPIMDPKEQGRTAESDGERNVVSRAEAESIAERAAEAAFKKGMEA